MTAELENLKMCIGTKWREQYYGGALARPTTAEFA